MTEQINPFSGTTPVDDPNDVLEYVTSTSDRTMGQDKYDFNSRVFPSNLGSDYLGHWMVININVQNESNFGSVQRTGGGDSFSDPSSLNWNLADGEKSKTDALRFGIDGYYIGKDGNPMTAPLANLLGAEIPVLNRSRFTKRIKESIALYMPNSELTFSDAHDFDNISLTKFGAAAGSNLAKFMLGGLGQLTNNIDAANLAGSMLDPVGRFVGNAAQIMGSPINPKVEVLFTNTFQREFTFDFIFSPSTPKESQDIANIIKTIRFHAAPETQQGSISTFFWIPPSEFDITFYYKDKDGNTKENTNIPRINTSVLKQIDVSYSPTGAYSTFTNGHPVQIRMQLRFIETEVVHKLRVMQGF